MVMLTLPGVAAVPGLLCSLPLNVTDPVPGVGLVATLAEEIEPTISTNAVSIKHVEAQDRGFRTLILQKSIAQFLLSKILALLL
jgi:hypothetical protein